MGKVDRSDYYKWIKNKNNKSSSNIDADITTIFYEVDETYGYRRLLVAIRKLGYSISENKLRKRMKLLGLVCKIRIKKRSYKHPKQNGIIKPNILNQEFKASKPNQKYSVDITQINTKKNPVYLNVIRDLFNGEPIVYKTSYHCDSKLAEDTIDLLCSKRNISNSIIHSDQGVTYSSIAYTTKLEKLNVIQSMSKKAYPYDNSMAENLFSIFKSEKINRLKYMLEDIDEVNEVTEEYFDFYTNRRISTALGGLTPKQYYDNFTL